MRRAEAAITIHRGLDKVWTRLAAPECWVGMTEAFSKKRGRYRHSLSGGPGQALGVGSEVQVAASSGKPVLRWRVSEWAPAKSLELLGDGPNPEESQVHLVFRFQLEELDRDSTRVTSSLVVLFTSRSLEFLSFLLPIGFFYQRGLRRCLDHLRDSVA